MEQASTTATTTADPRIRAVDEEGGVYEVSSRTREGRTHTVNISTGVCTCEAGQHSVACWHLDYARAIHYWHRYDARAQQWAARAAAVEERKRRGLGGIICPAGMAALQECYG